MVTGTILLFVKAPVAGTVKTRLIPALGAAGAAHLYQAMAMDTWQVVQQISDVRIDVAYQDHPEFPDPSWMAREVSWFSQEGQDLGERLIHATHHVFEDFPGPVIVLGSDLPALTPGRIQEAIQCLKTIPVVLGPSTDGGYYLIGLQQPFPALFQGISWSSAKVLAQTREILAMNRIDSALLSPERDLDLPEDLSSFAALEQVGVHFQRTGHFLKAWRRSEKSSCV